jgi:hypothetical protein
VQVRDCVEQDAAMAYRGDTQFLQVLRTPYAGGLTSQKILAIIPRHFRTGKPDADQEEA